MKIQQHSIELNWNELNWNELNWMEWGLPSLGMLPNATFWFDLMEFNLVKTFVSTRRLTSSMPCDRVVDVIRASIDFSTAAFTRSRTTINNNNQQQSIQLSKWPKSPKLSKVPKLSELQKISKNTKMTKMTKFSKIMKITKMIKIAKISKISNSKWRNLEAVCP